MAVTAPVPPARPTPPVPPGQAGNNSTNDGNSAFQPPDPGFVEAVKQAEAIGGALMKPAQKNAASTQPDEKTAASPPASQSTAKSAAPADNAAKTPAAPAFSAASAGDSAATGSEKAQTQQPPPADAGHRPATGIPYWPFAVVVLAVGVTLLLMKIFAAKQPKKKVRLRPPAAPPLEPGKVLRDKKPEEKKSRFEVRI